MDQNSDNGCRFPDLQIIMLDQGDKNYKQIWKILDSLSQAFPSHPECLLSKFNPSLSVFKTQIE